VVEEWQRKGFGRVKDYTSTKNIGDCVDMALLCPHLA
jgi:hypothetical protein